MRPAKKLPFQTTKRNWKRLIIVSGILLLVLLPVLIAMFVFEEKRPQKLSQSFSQEALAENVAVERTVSVEKAKEEDKYQPTMKLKLSKPGGEKLSRGFSIQERIPKEFAQNVDELEFSIPPTEILEKDPLVVWKFDEIEVGDSENVTYEISASKAASLIPQPTASEKIIEIEESPEPIKDVWSLFREMILKWVSGAVETLEIIVMRREPMEYKEAQKVYTETVVFLAGQAPVGEKPKEQMLTIQGQSPSPSSTFGQAVIKNKTQVYLQDKLLLEATQVSDGCFTIGQILYAPTNDYFLVEVSCFEADNELFLFKTDGSDKKQITGKWDVLNGDNVEWAADGKSFTYHRINSCCIEPERLGEKGPPVGMVRYDIATGGKTLIGPYLPKPTASVSPKTEGEKITTVAELKNLPDDGCGEFENDPARPITMKLEITEYVQLEFMYHEHYVGKDNTGTIDVYLQHFDLSAPDFWRVPTAKLTVGKTYLLKGCKPYIGTGGPGPGPLVFGVREEWPEAIVEK